MWDDWTGDNWRVDVGVSGVVVASDGHWVVVDPQQADDLTVSRPWFRCALRLNDQRLLRLRGISRQGARRLSKQVKRFRLGPEIEAACRWSEATNTLLETSLVSQRWIAREAVDELLRDRPDVGLRARVRRSRIAQVLGDRERDALAMVDFDVSAATVQANAEIMEAELRDRRDFFGKIEKRPLTDEQARAVVTYDNRVQVIAAAGSGKTSIMIARAAYAIDRGFTTPDRILLLAFNKAAATELQQRIEKRLAAAGINATGVTASTFHAYGMKLIGDATNAKPNVAPWVENGQEAQMIQRIVGELRESSTAFRKDWDMYRLLFASAPTTPDGGDADGYDRSSGTNGFWTMRGELVKSGGERIIADWLYLNGIEYEYERPYSVNTADASHSQYRPDFYYPDIDVWHEHWALDRFGKVPATFRPGYHDSMKWKRDLHSAHETKLIETSFGDIISGAGFAGLERQLTEHGLTCHWDPERAIATDARPLGDNDVARLVRTFMTHVKSNALNLDDLTERLVEERRNLAGYRTQLFLALYWPIHNEWDRRLRQGNYVDFEDMLLRAADHLESGTVETTYELVLVDEFQDSSQARARLVQGLVQRPGRYLLAVGDDWQSVNRFAGSDISVMTDFESWFGVGPTLQLTTTFRCPQSICDVATSFISKNPSQLSKVVTSAQSEHGPPVQLILADDPAKALERFFSDLSDDVASGTVVPGRTGQITVDVLGRYRFDSELMPSELPSNLDITFRTAHGSKGLEADYIVMPRVSAGRYGFPSGITDDPVLNLAMAAPDEYAHAEDRRLFYVALTRAIRQVTLISPRDKPSPFVTELLRDNLVAVTDQDGVAKTNILVCPRCSQGTMVHRTGRYGPFLGCSRFPSCKHTQQEDSLSATLGLDDDPGF